MSPTSHWEDQNSRARDETHGDALMHLLLKQVVLIPTEMYVYLYFIVYNVLWAQKAQLFRARERGSQWDAWQQYSSSTDWGSATSSHRFCWTSAEYIGCGCKESQSLGYKVGKSDAFWVHHPQPSDLPTWPWTPQLVLGGPVYTSGMVNPARPTGQANSNKS